jgi:hypothetical protein
LYLITYSHAQEYSLCFRLRKAKFGYSDGKRVKDSAESPLRATDEKEHVIRQIIGEETATSLAKWTTTPTDETTSEPTRTGDTEDEEERQQSPRTRRQRLQQKESEDTSESEDDSEADYVPGEVPQETIRRAREERRETTRTTPSLTTANGEPCEAVRQS